MIVRLPSFSRIGLRDEATDMIGVLQGMMEAQQQTKFLRTGSSATDNLGGYREGDCTVGTKAREHL